MEVAVFASASPYEHPIVIYFIVSMTRSWPNGYADKLWKVSKEGRSLLLWKEADAACGICYLSIWVFPKLGVPQNGWFIRENPIRIDDLGYPYLWKHPYLSITCQHVVVDFARTFGVLRLERCLENSSSALSAFVGCQSYIKMNLGNLNLHFFALPTFLVEASGEICIHLSLLHGAPSTISKLTWPRCLKSTGCSNPVVLIDEIDKLGRVTKQLHESGRVK